MPSRESSDRYLGADESQDTLARGASSESQNAVLPSLSADGLEILSSVGDVSVAYRKLQQGDRDAYAKIVEYFWPDLVQRVGWVIPPKLRGDYGSEDVANDVLFAFWQRVEQGKYPDIKHREDIFRILGRIVFNKAVKRLKMSLAVKRGGGNVAGGAVLEDATLAIKQVGIPGCEPQVGPAEEAAFRDLCDRLVKLLPEQGDLRKIGEAWLSEATSARSIKESLDLQVDLRSVQRKLETVLEIFGKELRRIEYDQES